MILNVYKYNSTCRDLINKDISHSCFCGDIFNKSDTSKFVKSLKDLIGKGNDLTTIVHSLRQVYLAKNIENLLVHHCLHFLFIE
jgi:hypothetical protein